MKLEQNLRKLVRNEIVSDQDLELFKYKTNHYFGGYPVVKNGNHYVMLEPLTQLKELYRVGFNYISKDYNRY